MRCLSSSSILVDPTAVGLPARPSRKGSAARPERSGPRASTVRRTEAATIAAVFCVLEAQKVLAIVFQLVDGFPDVRERLVLAGLHQPFEQRRTPAPGKLLQRAHVEIAIEKI